MRTILLIRLSLRKVKKIDRTHSVYPLYSCIFALLKQSYNSMKQILDMKVIANERLHPNYCLLRLASEKKLPEIFPGQFVEVRVDNSPTTFLRRPISIHDVHEERNEIDLLIQLVGDGTRKIAEACPGDTLNILLPLGNGFTLPTSQENPDMRLLLVGGGVGCAPLLYLGARLRENGFKPSFLIGARSKNDLLRLDAFSRLGEIFITTEDGSEGEKGYVTNHSILCGKSFDRIYTCGPKPMMMAVARYAAKQGVDCEVSLENRMACGLGACLCCVEKDREGHNVCVCKEGPVFNINQLSWLS